MASSESPATRADAAGGPVPPACALSLVMPCHRSGPALAQLVAQLLGDRDRLIGLSRRVAGPGYGGLELVLVHDGSGPETWSLCASLAQAPEVRAFDLVRRVGQVQATLCGLAQARGAVLVTLDDDLQHPADQVPLLLARLADAPSLDCVCGRYALRAEGVWRRLGSAAVAGVLRVLYGKPRGVALTSFRAMRRPLAEALVDQRSRVPLLGARILRLTRRVGDVAVRHEPRREGRSRYGAAGLLRMFCGLVLARVLPGGPGPTWSVRAPGGEA